MCFWLMKMLGTERWPVMPSSASWSAAPSSVHNHTTTSVNGCFQWTFRIKEGWTGGEKRTDLVELHEEVLGVFLIQQRLGRLAVGAVGLGEDNDAVVVDDLLGLGLGGGHGGGRGRGQGAEEAA